MMPAERALRVFGLVLHHQGVAHERPHDHLLVFGELAALCARRPACRARRAPVEVLVGEALGDGGEKLRKRQALVFSTSGRRGAVVLGLSASAGAVGLAASAAGLAVAAGVAVGGGGAEASGATHRLPAAARSQEDVASSASDSSQFTGGSLHQRGRGLSQRLRIFRSGRLAFGRSLDLYCTVTLRGVGAWAPW